MNRVRVLVIGSTGMLGSAVVTQLEKVNVEIIEASRTKGIRFDAEQDSCDDLLKVQALSSSDYVINCVGLTKGNINESDPLSVERAVRLNVLFPLALSRAAERFGIRMIQVATDCVFSGKVGGSTEGTAHDALDAYGKSKSLGEVQSENVLHLRCSLVGPELHGRKSLFFEWVRGLEHKAIVDGFVDHKWNGLTSQAFGSIVSGIVDSGSFFPGVQHLVPADWVTKYELVKMELGLLDRVDVSLRKATSGSSVDRRLETDSPEKNNLLFKLGGFETVPTIREMMEQLPWAELRTL